MCCFARNQRTRVVYLLKLGCERRGRKGEGGRKPGSSSGRKGRGRNGWEKILRAITHKERRSSCPATSGEEGDGIQSIEQQQSAQRGNRDACEIKLKHVEKGKVARYNSGLGRGGWQQLVQTFGCLLTPTFTL